jgi:hypothetical protein
MQPSTAVISAIAGYSAGQIRPFVDSVLRNTRADLHLLDLPRQPAPPWLARLAALPRIHLHVCNQVMPPRAMGVLRFPLILRLLASVNAELLLLCDSRDAIVQADPFAGLAGGSMASSLWLAQEDRCLRECPINMGWLQRDGSAQEVDAIQHQPILCGGTILGTHNALTMALGALVDRIQAHLPPDNGSFPWALDQSSLNLLAWQGQLGVPFTPRGDRDGFALTLHHGHHLMLDRAGRVLLGNGEVAPVVHQYDRIPWLAEHLHRQLDGIYGE